MKRRASPSRSRRSGDGDAAHGPLLGLTPTYDLVHPSAPCLEADPEGRVGNVSARDARTPGGGRRARHALVSALLPQAGGFEGVSRFMKPGIPGYLAVAESPQGRLSPLHFDA